MKWSLRRAVVYGFIVGLAMFGLVTVSDGGGSQLRWLHAAPYERVGYFFGIFTAWPLLFLIVALVRNRFVGKRSPRATTLSARVK